MNMLSKFKKGQGLPLNTIVIAILVVIVLLVIVVFFTSNVGETGEQIEGNSPTSCSMNNPAIATIYSDKTDSDFATADDDGGSDDSVCDGAGYTSVRGVPNCCVTE